MGSGRVKQGFFFDAWRYAPMNHDVSPVFFEDRTHFDVTATGSYLQTHGHIQMLSLLKKHISPWVTATLTNRLLLPEQDTEFLARIARYTWPKEPVMMPCRDHVHGLAHYFLETFLSFGLDALGCEVTEVSVRRSRGEHYVAIVDESFIRTAAYKDPDPRFRERPKVTRSAQYSATV